jgi:hypothetical protein
VAAYSVFNRGTSLLRCSLWLLCILLHAVCALFASTSISVPLSRSSLVSAQDLALITT